MSVSENAFRQWAEDQGWKTTKRGWPDFLCRRDGALMVVEVKAGPDVLRAEQVQALRDLHAAGIATFIWTRESGLRPYPAETVASDGSLALRLLELESALRLVISDRDRLAAELADHKHLGLRPLRPLRAPLTAEERMRKRMLAEHREEMLRSRMLPERYERMLLDRARRHDPAEVLLRNSPRHVDSSE